jgi:hypothetical protein
VGSVDFDLRSLFARAGLIASQAGHPGVQSRQEAVERLDLPNAAAEFALLDVFVEEIQSVVANHRLHALGIRKDDFDGLVVPISHPIDEIVGGLRKAPRIEHEDARGGVDPVHHVEQNEPLGSAERTREGDVFGKIIQSPSQDFLRAQRFSRSGLDVLQYIDIKTIY